MNKLTFGKNNAKLGKGKVDIYTFSLPAGWSCPGALSCLAKADRQTGKLTDGAVQQFRCFAASAEARHTSVRVSRWRNFEALKGKSREEMATLILESLPRAAEAVRIHVSGDFFNAAYFLAWCDVARARPAIRFYAYTKSIPIWRQHEGEVPGNLVLTASEGGRYDAQIGDRKRATVVFSEEQAAALNLAIDHDDSHAMEGTESFALLLHGTQQKGTPAAKALSALRAEGWTGYGKAS